MEIDHQVAVHVAHPGEGAGGDHVEDHFLHGSGLHARGSGQNFGADSNYDAVRGDFRDRSAGVCSDADRDGPFASRISERAESVWGPTADGESDNDILDSRFLASHVKLTHFGGVFADFSSVTKGVVSAGDEVLDHTRGDVKGGDALGGVERAEASAGSRTDINKTPSGRTGLSYEIDSLGDGRKLFGDGLGDVLVLGVDDASDFESRFFVEIDGVGIGDFGAELAKLSQWRHVKESSMFQGHLCLKCHNYGIVEFGTNVFYGLAVAIGPDPIGQERDAKLAHRIAPDRSS